MSTKKIHASIILMVDSTFRPFVTAGGSTGRKLCVIERSLNASVVDATGSTEAILRKKLTRHFLGSNGHPRIGIGGDGLTAGKHIPYQYVGEDEKALINAFAHEEVVHAKGKVGFDGNLEPTKIEISEILLEQPGMFGEGTGSPGSS